MLNVLLLGIFVLLNKAFTEFLRAPSPYNEVIRTSVDDGLILNAILTLINADLCKNVSTHSNIFMKTFYASGPIDLLTNDTIFYGSRYLLFIDSLQSAHAYETHLKL